VYGLWVRLTLFNFVQHYLPKTLIGVTYVDFCISWNNCHQDSLGN